MKTPLPKQCIAEFIGTFVLNFVGVCAIYQNAGDLGGLVYGRFLIKQP